MSAETVLYSTLSADTGVDSLVDGRIYPDVAPQDGDLPAIAFERVGTEYHNTIHGTAIATRVSMEAWCMGETRADAESVCDAVELAARAATFFTTGRRAEFDPETNLWAAVLSLDYWQT